MRFMMIIKADKNMESGQPPDWKIVEAMGKYNEELMKAGVLLTAEGLHPTSKGVRIKFSGGKSTVVEGPFKNPSDLIAGYWLINVKSKQEAIEWAKKVPMEAGDTDGGGTGEIELRQIYEMEEFPKELRDSPTFKKLQKAEQKFREQTKQ